MQPSAPKSLVVEKGHALEKTPSGKRGSRTQQGDLALSAIQLLPEFPQPPWKLLEVND